MKEPGEPTPPTEPSDPEKDKKKEIEKYLKETFERREKQIEALRMLMKEIESGNPSEEAIETLEKLGDSRYVDALQESVEIFDSYLRERKKKD